ncbi:MAG: hypothetical protein QG559_1302 [Campylobacterota bacterium]|nr:hypothetical protein [Campylobacterota bacterium]
MSSDIGFEKERFALMGEILSNISHQWKQPLNTISLAAMATKTSFDKTKNLDKNLDIIEDSINSLSTTMDGFFDFFNPKNDSVLKDIDTAIGDIERIIAHHLQNKKIKLTMINNAQETKVVSILSLALISIINEIKKSLLELNEKEITLTFNKNGSFLEIEFNTSLDNINNLDFANKIIKNIFKGYIDKNMIKLKDSF